MWLQFCPSCQKDGKLLWGLGVGDLNPFKNNENISTKQHEPKALGTNLCKLRTGSRASQALVTQTVCLYTEEL